MLLQGRLEATLAKTRSGFDVEVDNSIAPLVGVATRSLRLCSLTLLLEDMLMIVIERKTLDKVFKLYSSINQTTQTSSILIKHQIIRLNCYTYASRHKYVFST